MIQTKMAVITVCRLVWLGLCVSFFVSAQAYPSPSEMPFVGLVVLSEPHLRLTGRNQADYEIGKINSLDNLQVEHRFTVRNEGESPLAITNLEADCHCTTATVERIADNEPSPNDTFVYYLPPGQEMVIKLTVQLARQLSGPMSHGIAIYVSGHERAAASLHIIGEMELALTLTPSELDFGQMKLGETYSRTITIRCDKRLLSRETLPRLECECPTNPGFKSGPVVEIVSQTESSPVIPVKSDSAMLVETYLVTVQPKQTGELTARLFFATFSPTDYKGTISYDRAVEVFRGVQIEVHGTVAKR